MEHRLLGVRPTAAGSSAHSAGARLAVAGRLVGIDRLRIGLTALVIAHHAGQAYGPTGGEWPVFEAQRAAILGPFFAVNAAFFMGMFFLLAGLFTPAAIDRRGVRSYLGERLARLGMPLAIFALLIFPTIGYLESDRAQPYLGYLVGDLARGEPEFGHLWFVLHLLIYSALYALWRAAGGRRAEARLEGLPAPGHRAIIGYTLALTLVTALVRLWFPIDAWPRLFGLVPAEAAHLPQYLSLFVVGLLAGRAGWLERLPAQVGRVWLAVGLAAAALRYAYALAAPGLVPDGLADGGGASWGALIWSGWEALICVGLCVGLLSAVRGVRATPGRLEGGLAAGAYGAYLVHIFPVVALQMLLLPLPLAPLAKFALVTAAAVPLSFALAAAPRLWRHGA